MRRADLGTGMPSPDQRFTAVALAKGAERARGLKAARPLFGRHSLGEIALLLDTSASTLCRWRQDFGHLTDEQLTVENLAGETGNCGATSKWEQLGQQPDVRRRLQELYLLSCGASSAYMTVGRRTGSAAAVLKVFSEDPL